VTSSRSEVSAFGAFVGSFVMINFPMVIDRDSPIQHQTIHLQTNPPKLS
jgi:hypothetical protein